MECYFQNYPKWLWVFHGPFTFSPLRIDIVCYLFAYGSSLSVSVWTMSSCPHNSFFAIPSCMYQRMPIWRTYISKENYSPRDLSVNLQTLQTVVISWLQGEMFAKLHYLNTGPLGEYCIQYSVSEIQSGLMAFQKQSNFMVKCSVFWLLQFLNHSLQLKGCTVTQLGSDSDFDRHSVQTGCQRDSRLHKPTKLLQLWDLKPKHFTYSYQTTLVTCMCKQVTETPKTKKQTKKALCLSATLVQQLVQNNVQCQLLKPSVYPNIICQVN